MALSKDGGIMKRQHSFAALIIVLGVWATDAPGTNVFHDVSALFNGSAPLLLLRRAHRHTLTECVHDSLTVSD